MINLQKIVFGVGFATVVALSFLGFVVVWTSIDDSEFNDTVIIEYSCPEVLKMPYSYPDQVIRECTAKRMR